MPVGQSVPMVDARARVTGAVEYALNFELPGMLAGRILRSPYPHARVRRVDASRAEQLPGVLAVLSRNDLLGQDRIFPYFGPIVVDQPVVALDKVRYVGDCVAAVAAVDEDVAEEALRLIEVDYEELPAVFDPEEALKPGAPLIHEGPRRVNPSRPDVAARSKEGTNIVHRFIQRKGDIERGFAESDHIFENTFTNPAVQHMALEPQVAIARVADGRVTVWATTQTPYFVQAQLADVFRVPVSDVQVIVFTLGGGFGAKSHGKLEPVAALLAWKAGRPVRLAMRREEDVLILTKHAAKICLKTGVKQDGTLIAQQATCYFNGGAYADNTSNVILRAYACTGPYRVPHVWVDSYGVYTNVVPAGPFRGLGISQVAWAHESQMDIIADALGIDPLELRLKNVLLAGDAFSTGEPMLEMHYPELLQEAARRIGWNNGPTRIRQGNKIRAKGLSVIVKGMTTPSASTAFAKLHGDGSLNVLTSSVEMGQGAKTVLAQIAAHEAGLPLERVRISNPDTSVTPYDMMTAASRTTLCMGNAIREAVRDVKRQLVELGAEQFEVAEEDVVVEGGRVSLRGAPDRSFSYPEVIRTARCGNVLGRGTVLTGGGLDLETGQGIGAGQWHPAVAACEVEVDVETGKIEVVHLHSGVYVGRMINPRQCLLQVQGSLLFGLGQALFEEVQIDSDGRITNPNFADYMVPSFEDVPRELSAEILEDEGDTEIHGIGETSLPGVMPAVANALSRALGVRIADLPLTPEKVLNALEAKEGAEAQQLVEIE